MFLEGLFSTSLFLFFISVLVVQQNPNKKQNKNCFWGTMSCGVPQVSVLGPILF